ncbi:NUDIX hydrolase N-terminal domain-containing protein [Paenibacillus alvei]|uniref:NUDIX hydrolase N-terminal domain-containing protein n=1 Tax=Paenibacillus alvei TaxID=44250 RepID=UPI0018CE7B8A|nr:NUDIX hydrolase N-terminal domain-containing protein [Paenibacillus alvei]
MIRAVLFDFDGTLADTLPLTLHVFQDIFKRYDNRMVSKEQIIAMFGPTEEGILTANMKYRGLLPTAIEEYFELYHNWHASLVHSSPAIIQMLQALKKQGIAIGIITGKGRRAYQISNEALGLSPYVDIAITGDEVTKPKPDPEGIHAALAALHVRADEAIWIGDSNADIEAGLAANVHTIGAKWFGTVQSATFEKAPHDIFSQPSELTELVQQSLAHPAIEWRQLHWAKRIQALAQIGLTYSDNPYDRERYEELRDISVDMMTSCSDVDKEQVRVSFASDTGYATPKVDVRGVVFRDGKLLLVKEKADGAWSLPGGWADIGFSPSEVVVKEIQEESGFQALAIRLLAVLDKRFHQHPPEPNHVYKLFILCDIIGGEAMSGTETSGVGFFAENELPPLSAERNTEAQLRLLFQIHGQPDHAVILD